MNRHFREEQRGSFILSAGWLFADMLLVLSIIFLAANTFSYPKSSKPKTFTVKLTSTPTPIVVPTPTLSPTPPTNALILEPNRVTLILTQIDPDKLSKGDKGSITDLENKIKAQIIQRGLQNRRAGIEIAYGGADSLDPFQVNRGDAVSKEVYTVLDMLGRQGFVFCHTVHYVPLFTTLHPHDTVIIDIYLFSSYVEGC